MKLKRLEIFGFKSFADRTVIEFDQGITGVVGPNGSGKSNISDAIRWVLGEQSARTLRGGKMEDIIFSGSEKRKPLAYCEVSLVFDNEDKALPTDYAEVAVTRRVYRSGESEYRINRTACRLKDVVDLFRDSGIGREGYSIMGQGKVDQILSDKPEDRRNVFHEAAGIMKFRSRKEEAQKNLARTQENLTRITDIMQVMETQIGPLKRQSENARTYLKLSERLKALDVNRFIAEYDGLNGQITRGQARLAQLDQVLEQQALDIARRTALQQEDGEAMQQLEAAWMAAQQEEGRLRGLLSENQSAHRVGQERAAHLVQEQARLEAEARQAELKAEALRLEASQRREALNGSGEARAELERQLEEETRHLAGLDQHIEQQEVDLEAQKQAAMAELGRLSDVKSALSRMEAQRGAMAERLEHVTAAMEQSGQSRQAWLQTVEETRLRVEALEQDTAEYRRQAEEASARQTEMSQRLAGMNDALARLREQARESRTRLTMLQNMKRDYEGYNNTVKSLLRDTRRDQTLAACVDAVVAEVLRVPSNYILAIETALGAASGHIITADEQAAKKLIGYLRAKQYGRATFLPLTTIRGRVLSEAERAKLRHEGFCGVASELVECDSRYRAVADNLLGRTVIAKDLDAAIALSRACQNSLRVVTLQGDVMNPGGSMTGGSIRARVTSVLGRDQEIEQTQDRMDAMAGQLREMEVLRDQEGAGIETLRERRRALSAKAHDAEIELARERERLDKAQANADRFVQEYQQQDEERRRLETGMEDLSERMEAARDDGQTIEAGSADFNMEMSRRQRELNILREQRDEVMERVSMLRATAMADERDRAAVEEQIRRDLAEAGEYDGAAAGYRAQAEENLTGQQALSQAQARGAREYEALSAALEEEKAEIARILARREELRRKMEQAAAALGEAQQASHKTEQQRYELNGQLERAARELESLQNRIWELYELTYANALALKDETLMGEEARNEAERLRREIRALGPVNVQAIEEYAQVKDKYEEYSVQCGDLTQAKERLEQMVEQIAGQMEKLFRESFEQLNHNFNQTFQALFGGGQAFIKLEDEHNILESGIDMHVQPPGKKLQLLTLLSGGERALTAIALLFAMIELKPTPFCVLDEIEAALDEANISHFTDYVKAYAAKTQFVIITHRKSTMECCDALYGVTMQERGVSRMLHVRMNDVIKEEVS